MGRWATHRVREEMKRLGEKIAETKVKGSEVGNEGKMPKVI